ncbi:MmgE/PrpD family protein [Roseobacter sp. MED193]|uniref:MmgE/PrpD family protein n=1 Tax=Roseobacter sp. MED193 TaxID=314262 RepID=UPI000068AD8B|nr:MmgE/PrpD family protein [Roseobacter sp. MED193]EAQ45089.1 MmgE/PrpD family protein [Roseobacter sp. MED193]
MSSTFTGQLAAFAISDTRPNSAALKMAQLSALDWLACGIAGVTEPVAQILRAQALAEAGAAQATLFGGTAVPARMAALANGTISHALDYDDTHFAHIGHPSVAVFSAAFALGQLQGRSVSQIIEAALFGMELSIRLGVWLGRSHYQMGFHQTATAGAFGATAASGRLLGLTPGQMEMALGLCATRAAGLKAQFGTMGKPYNAGLAATAGVEVAQLVAAGFEANPEALEGALGFGGTHHGEGNRDAALQDLGRVWLCEEISHKFHACCHGLHAALEAARSLDLAAPEIASLTVRTHPRWMTVCNQTAPETGLGAKFSYRTVLALQALGKDTARLDSYSAALCRDPRLVGLRDLIHVQADESLTETQAYVTLVRRDGRRLEASHDLQTPVAYELRQERLMGKVQALIGAERSAALWAMLQGSGSAADIAAHF